MSRRAVARAFALASLLSASADAPPADVVEPPPYEQFVVIPLRVRILTATDLPEVDCRLTDTDIARILRKVNGIWNKAGIHWGLESLERVPAAHQAQFRLARDLDGLNEFGLFRILIPESPREADGLQVYYLHELPVNGIWLGGDFAMVKETASLRPVEGGIDEPLPRVTAHELGHALGLSHRQDRTNLLASGTTGTSLNAREVEVARRKAGAIRGASTVDVLRRKAMRAAEAGETGSARRYWTWLAEVPGAGSADARRQLDELEREGDAKASASGR